MRRYNKTVKAEAKKRMSLPERQNVAGIFQQLGIHVAILYSPDHGKKIQARRHRSQVDAQARCRHPRRRSGSTRSWWQSEVR